MVVSGEVERLLGMALQSFTLEGRDGGAETVSRHDATGTVEGERVAHDAHLYARGDWVSLVHKTIPAGTTARRHGWHTARCVLSPGFSSALCQIGLCLALSAVCYKLAMPFFIGMLAPGIVDFLTQGQWAYNHLFPFPFAPMRSIVSYTDVGFTLMEHALLLLCVVWWMLQRRRMHPGANRKQ